MKYAFVMLLPIFVVFLPVSAEFDLHGGWNCPTDDLEYAIQEYRKTIQTRNQLWDSYLKENPNVDHRAKVTHIITEALGYAGNQAECLKVQYNIKPDSIAKLSPELRMFLEDNYFFTNTKYPGFVKYVLDYDGKVKVPSPLQQYRAESREEIQCRNEFMFVRKASNGYPACVSYFTGNALLQRGWGTLIWPFNQIISMDYLYDIQINEKKYTLNYSIFGANLTNIEYNESSASILVNLENTTSGLFTIHITSEMLESILHHRAKHIDEVDYIVLANGMEVVFDELRNNDSRTIMIPIGPQITKIEIISAYPP